uniref:Reverse transcriptase domain-containing protein n=1 Tax=Strongyloides papillosus TaxID=174720 RepID=A0A0N5BSH9_STREA
MKRRSSILVNNKIEECTLDELLEIYKNVPMKERLGTKMMDWKKCCEILQIPPEENTKLKQKAKTLGFYEEIKKIKIDKTLEKEKNIKLKHLEEKVSEIKKQPLDWSLIETENVSTTLEIRNSSNSELTINPLENIFEEKLVNIKEKSPVPLEKKVPISLIDNNKYKGIVYDKSNDKMLLELANKHLYDTKRGILVNWQLVCFDLGIGSHEANKIRHAASRLGFTKPSELPKVDEVNIEELKVLESEITVDEETVTDITKLDENRTINQIKHFMNLKKEKFNKLKIYPFDLNSKLNKEIIDEFDLVIPQLLNNTNNYEEKFKILKCAMLAIQAVIKHREKMKNKESKKSINRLISYNNLIIASIKSLKTNKSKRTNKDKARIRKINKKLRLKMSELLEHLECLSDRLTNEIEMKENKMRMGIIFKNFDIRPSLKTVIPRKNNEKLPLKIEDAYKFYQELYEEKAPPPPLPIVNEFFNEIKNTFSNKKFKIPSRKKLEEIVCNAANFLTCGPDGIPGKFLVRLKCGKNILLDFIEEIWQGNTKLITKELCEGNTVLLPKTDDEEKLTLPNFYRPITTLNHIYKLLTTTFHKTLLDEIEDTILTPISQKALKTGSRGCSDALLKDIAINLDNLYRIGKDSRKHLEVGWIDLQKAFDSPYAPLITRLIETLPLVKTAISSLLQINKSWSSKIKLNNELSENYDIARGLPQGDALSPLLYCMLTAIIPFAINKLPPLQTNLPPISSISVYMDDTKIYGNSSKDLSNKLELVQNIYSNLGLKFNNSKSATIGEEINPENLREFPRLNDKESYKYLGINQKFISDINNTEKMLINETLIFMRKIKNLKIPTRMIAKLLTNTFAPKVSYVANHTFYKGKTSMIITLGDKLDSIIRSELSEMFRIYKNSLKSRIYLPRKEGGRGFPSLKNEIVTSLITIGAYAAYSEDEETRSSNRYLARVWHNDDHKNNKKTPIGVAIKLGKKIGLPVEEIKNKNEVYFKINNLTNVTEITRFTKEFLLNEIRNKYKDSKHFEIMNRENYSPISFHFLSCNISPKLESVICHAQERQILANTNTNCKYCPNTRLTLNHILTSCSTRQGRGLIRHNLVLKCLVNKLLELHNLPKLSPDDSLRSVPKIDLYVDRVFNEYDMDSCRPDLVFIPSHLDIFLICDIAISNVHQIESQKQWKYHKYCVNGNDTYEERSGESINLLSKLKEKYKKNEGIFLPLVIGSLGEIQQETVDSIKTIFSKFGLKLRKMEIEEMLKEMHLHVVKHSYMMLVNHLEK